MLPTERVAYANGERRKRVMWIAGPDSAGDGISPGVPDFAVSRVTMVIGDHEAAGGTGATIHMSNPATGRKIAGVPEGASRDVDRAVSATRAALNGERSRLPPADRRRRMPEPTGPVEADGESAVMSRSIGAGGSAERMRHMAGRATGAEGSALDVSIPVRPGARMEQVGVAGAVAPWDFPLNMAVWKIAPAHGPAAAGGTVGVQAMGYMGRVTFEPGGEAPMHMSSVHMADNVEMDRPGALAGTGALFDPDRTCRADTRIYPREGICHEISDFQGGMVGSAPMGAGLSANRADMTVSAGHRTHVSARIAQVPGQGGRPPPKSGAYEGEGVFAKSGIHTDMRRKTSVTRDGAFGPVVTSPRSRVRTPPSPMTPVSIRAPISGSPSRTPCATARRSTIIRTSNPSASLRGE